MRKLFAIKAFSSFMLLVVGCFSLQAQSDQQSYNLSNVIPPSPNASSLGKYVDWPVNLYTGVPQIDIPIYELKGRSLSVPISLSYHASGIKVGENASCVGLGWSLQAGGVITRSVRGLADDDPSGYLGIRSYYNNPGDLSSGSIATGPNNAFTDSSLQLSISNGNADSQPDLYMFNALGRSYKFYFSGNGTIVTQPYSNLKIIFNSGSNSTWTVILEDGMKLLFGGSTGFVELTTTQATTSTLDTYTSSWYLKSITSPTGETINFTYYTSGSVTLDSYFYESDYLLNAVMVNSLTVGVPVTTKAAKTIGQTLSVNMQTVATIESDLCKVYFDNTTRSDLPGSVAVSGIRVFSKLQNKTIQSYILNYGYSTATSGNVYTQGSTTSAYRLKLNSMEEVPADNGPHKIWQFAYNPLALPSRKSYAQDYWGYYNGALANTTLKPFLINFNPDNYAFGYRAPDSVSMMAEMLTSVTYPTGGYSQFNYEPNSYPANEEVFTSVPVNLGLYLTYGQSNFSNTTSNTFTITKPQYFKFQFSGNFSTTYLNDFGTGVTLASASLKTYPGGTNIIQRSITKPASGNSVAITSSSVLLDAGTYSFTMSSISNQGDFGSTAQTVVLNSSFGYMGSLGVQAVNHKVGGVRVKSIVYSDNVDNTKSIVKNYVYEGATIVYPVDTTTDYVSQIVDDLYDCNSPPNNITACGIPGCLATSVGYYERNASTKSSLGSIQGGTVGYTKVTESFGSNGQGGKNIYYYSYANDYNLNSAKGFPYPPIISYDYERGLLLEKDIYTADGKIISKELNSYGFVNRSAITAYKVTYLHNILSGCFTYTYLANLLKRVFYQDKTDQVKKTSTAAISFNTSTGDSLVSTTNFYYDDTLNMQPVRLASFNSKGDSVLVYSRTALEKSDINSSITLSTTASTAIDSMVVRNMVGIPLESEKYTKSILTNKVLSNYKVQANGFVQPDNVMTQNAGNNLESRVRFNRYNGTGNLIEQQKASDAKHVYVWDYSNTYGVAEVVNADSSSTAYTSFEADGSGNWTLGSGLRDTVTAAITGNKSYVLSNGSISKSGLSGVRYYRVSYWNRNGTAYTIAGTTAGFPVQGKTVNGWTYFEHRVTGQTSIALSGSGNIDELRLYPDSAQMVTYTYQPLVGISSQCDINNRITYYQYDAFNRLYIVKDQDGNTIKKYCYGYNGQSIACSQFYSVAKSQAFTRNNCASGYNGSTVTYNVPAGKYASLISQADADQQAQNDVNANGQNYANANGTCTIAPVTVTAINNAGVSGFNAVFTNTSTSVQTSFSIPSGGGTLGTLSPGTYNVTISKSGNTIKYIFTVCSSTKAAATSATFTSMAISSTCSIVQIDTVN